MPSRAEIQKEITETKQAAQDTVRRKYLRKAQKLSGRDTILYCSGWTSGRRHQKVPSQLFSLSTDDVQGVMAALNGLEGDALDIIIHSPGGSLESADQIVQYLRSKYNNIRAIIPHNAMSAATMLACACDEIVMGRQSAIGPIDPQLSWVTANGPVTAAAQSILDELNTAKKDVGENPRLAPIWATRIRDYPPGIFETCSITMSLSRTLVGEWLEKYMFREDPERSQKAQSIAAWLADAAQHKTHGKPLGLELCRDHGLKVTSLEENQDFQDAILSVFHASAVTFEVTNCIKIIENHNGRGYYLVMQGNANGQ